MWRPFKPNSFQSAAEAMRGTYKQGTPYAFYKGNGVRALHILLFHKLNTDLGFRAESGLGQLWQRVKETPYASELVLSCTVDFCLQPLHVAETRFILQNRLANYCAYSSLADYWRKTPLSEMFRGNLLHVPRNFLVALQGMRLTD